MSVVQNNQRIAKNTIFLYLRMAIVMAVNLYTTRVVLNALGVEDFGIYNVVCGFVTMFGFLNTSMTGGIQRYYNYELGKNGTNAVVRVYNTALTIQMMVAVLLVIILEGFGVWYLNCRMVIDVNRLVSANWVFQFSVISLLLLVMQVPYSAAILAYERMDYYAIVSVLDAVIKLGIAIGLPYVVGDKLTIYGLLIMLIQVGNVMLYYLYCKKNFPFLRLKFDYDQQLMKSMLSFSGWNMFGSFAYAVKGQGVNVLLNAFFGTIVNAANGIASQISSAIQTFSANLVVAFKPQLIQTYASGSYQRTEKLMFSMSKISYILMCLIAIPIIVEIDYILQLWLGEDAIPDNTAIFSSLTVAALMINTLNTPVVQVIHATGKMRNFQIATSLVVCSILPLSWICLECGFESVSVFWVSIILAVVNQIVCLAVLHAYFKYSIRAYILDIVVPCIAVTVISYALSHIVASCMEESFGRVCLTTLCSTLSILVLFVLLLNKEEKSLLHGLLKKIIKK